LNGIAVDASVSAAWLLPDEENELAQWIFRRLDENAAFVPSIWDYEIRNILIVNERRGRITREAADAGLSFLTGLNIIRDRSTNWTAVAELSRRFTLTIYDAAYLELSVRLDLSLATSLISAAAQLDRLAGTSPTP
jgi:predicted nucleic acid-binding protein